MHHDSKSFDLKISFCGKLPEVLAVAALAKRRGFFAASIYDPDVIQAYSKKYWVNEPQGDSWSVELEFLPYLPADHMKVVFAFNGWKIRMSRSGLLHIEEQGTIQCLSPHELPPRLRTFVKLFQPPKQKLNESSRKAWRPWFS